MAKNGSNAFGLRLILFVGIVLVATVIGYFIIRPSDKLPIYHPAQLDQRLVDPSLKGAKGEHRINDFHLTDQFGGNFTLNDVGHRIIVADFFFTTCATICPKMTTQMERVQEAYKDDPRLLLLSHSVTPEMDSVPVLAAYAELHNADPDRWRFLTGDRRDRPLSPSLQDISCRALHCDTANKHTLRENLSGPRASRNPTSRPNRW